MGTLDSEIDVGQEINIGSGKFGKKNKHRALNKDLEKIPKLINLGPTSILECRVDVKQSRWLSGSCPIFAKRGKKECALYH